MTEGRLQELYFEAIELEGEARRALLARLRDEEPELAARLDRLLERPEAAASPLDSPPIARLVATGSGATPDRIGPYRVVRELGQGGMGRVFLAEQETPDFKRVVALKLIDRPVVDEEAVRRFRAEVRILASLDHPGIVRFLDGGQSAEGIWFLALEYVEGEDLLTHATHRGLGASSRARLLAEVARAVAFAHARGVVHRDLKPGNVLVALDGRPHLLDFGISRLLEPGRAGGSTATSAGARPLTPAYASPEQLRGEPGDAASDVYSLGVMLYELLAGTRPATSTAGGAVDPPSRIRRRTGSLRSTGVEPGRRLRRALDAICLKALAALPADRYQTAAELADDLERALDGRPLSGRAPGSMSGWTPRSRAALLSAGALGLSAIAVLALFRWAQERPSPETRRAAGGPTQAAPQARAGFPFDPLDPPAAEELERRFAATPTDVVAGAALALRLAKDRRLEEADLVVLRLRQIPGHETDPLTDYAEGRIASRRQQNQRALVFLTRARDSAIAQSRSELLGEIRGLLGSVLAEQGLGDAAIAELELALADSERAGNHVSRYRTANDLAIAYLQRGDIAPGREALERALAAAAVAGLTPLVALANLAELELNEGRVDEAERQLRRLLELRRLHDPGPRREAQVLAKLSEALREQGRVDEADVALAEAISLFRTLEREPDLAIALYLRAAADLQRARLGEVEALAEEIEAVARDTVDRRALGHAALARARLAAIRGDRSAARRDFAESRAILRAQGELDLAAGADLEWALAELRFGETHEADRILSEALATLEHPRATRPGYFAELLRIRSDARSGHATRAGSRLHALGPEGARSPSVSRRLAFAAAAAAVAIAENRPEEGRATLVAAIALARDSGRELEALELRFELARHRTDVRALQLELLELESEARALGALDLAARCRTSARALPDPRRG